jgi:hypothetical protein
VISGYATAVGQVFSVFTSSHTDAQAAALSKTKWAYCQAIIAQNPLSGKKGPDLDTAAAAIKSACQ